MTDTYKTTRVYRERHDGDSDDEHFKSTTVTRYKVNPSRGSRYERTERLVEVDDDRRARYPSQSGDRSSEFLDWDRRERTYAPDRPRSRLDDRPRTVVYEQETERDRREDWERRPHHRHSEDDVRVEKRVEERFDDAHGHEIDRYRKETEYYHHHDAPSSPVVIRQRAPDQKIIVHEAPRPDPSVIVLRERESDREVARNPPYDEEYYYRHERHEVGPDRGGRSRSRAHKHDHDSALAKRDRRRREEDGYWSDDSHDYRRTSGRRQRSESPDHHHKLHLAEGALAGAGVSALLASRRDKNGEMDDHHGRKVLAGAALGALGTEVLKRAHSAYGDSWRGDRESPDRHSTLKTTLGIAAVALAAAGATKLYEASKADREEYKRGRSRTRGYDSSSEDSRSRSRSRAKSRRRSLSNFAKAALGTAVTAGVVKHLRNKSKSRSRSRHDKHASRSRSKSKVRRGAELAGAAAAAGIASKVWKDHHDTKEAKRREESSTRGPQQGRDDGGPHRKHGSRSRSRSHARSERRSTSQSRSRSRSRSMARSLGLGSQADREAGFIEYGNDPIDAEPRTASGRGYEDEAEERRRNRRRRRDRPVSSESDWDSTSDREHDRSRLKAMAEAGAAAIVMKEFHNRQASEDEEKQDRKHRERLEEAKLRREREDGDLKTDAKLRERQEKEQRRQQKDADRERERERKREREWEREREREREKQQEKEQRRERHRRREAEKAQERKREEDRETEWAQEYSEDRYIEATPGDSGPFRDHHPDSPPNVSGGGYFPSPYMSTPGAEKGDHLKPQEPLAPPKRVYSPYVPLDYMQSGYSPPPPPPPAGPPPTMSGANGGYEYSSLAPPPLAPAPLRIPPPVSDNFPPPPDHVSDLSTNHARRDGGNPEGASTRGVKATHKEYTPYIPRDDPPQLAKQVSFGPLSPKSSKTMERHRRDQALKDSGSSEEDPVKENSQLLVRMGEQGAHRRQSSDMTHDLHSDSEGEVENLPERFDAQGQPLGGAAPTNRWASRSGVFHRESGDSSDWKVEGAWSVGGTDPVQVDRLVRNVTGALEGRSSWMAVIGEVLGAAPGLLQGVEQDGRRKRKR